MATDSSPGATTISLRIPADESWIHIARLAASGVAARLDMDLDRLEDLKLAVSEACVDRLETMAALDLISIDFHVGATELVVDVAGDQPDADDGASVDDENYALTLMQAVVDGVSREVNQEGVLIIRLTMRIGGQEAPESAR